MKPDIPGLSLVGAHSKKLCFQIERSLATLPEHPNNKIRGLKLVFSLTTDSQPLAPLFLKECDSSCAFGSNENENGAKERGDRDAKNFSSASWILTPLYEEARCKRLTVSKVFNTPLAEYGIP